MKAQVEGVFQSLPEWSWSLLSALLVAAVLVAWNKRKTRSQIAVKMAPRPRPDRRKVRTEQERKEHQRNLTAKASMGTVGIIGLALSLNTSLRFGQTRLNFEGTTLWTLGLGIEAVVVLIAVFSSAARDRFTAFLGYVLVIAQIVAAYEVAQEEKGDAGVFVWRMVGPLVLLLALHKLLKLEAKLDVSRLKVQPDGRIKKLWNKALANLDARAGIAEEDLSAAQIARRRSTEKAAKIATAGDGWWAIKGLRKRRLRKAVRKTFRGTDAFQRLEVEADLVDQIDMANSVDGLRNRTSTWNWSGSMGAGRTLRPDPTPGGEPGAGDEANPSVTSGGEVRPDQGRAGGAPGATGGGAKASQGPVTGDPVLIRQAFELYCELGSPSQNAFELTWRDRAKEGQDGYPGMKTDRVRELYQYIHGNMKKSP